ncbi:MAG TPA: hypothetical protein VJZ98_07890, partial [Actinomycetota bacterium]|nr:hypothetical protein [Actinomycetota bacterium]
AGRDLQSAARGIGRQGDGALDRPDARPPRVGKPALACLSSRVEFGIRILPELLARIDEAEAIVRALGFEVVRVRHHGASATVEVPAGEVARLLAHPERDAAFRALAALGWAGVAVDPNGYRPGGATPPPSGT